jgi:DNA-binding CsgD family transcriptional regulator
MKVLIVADECPAKLAIAAVLADSELRLLLPNDIKTGVFEKSNAVVYIAQRPDLFIVGLLRSTSNLLIIIGGYDLGSELFIPIIDFQGSVSDVLPAAVKVRDFIKERLSFFDTLNSTQSEILALMLLGYIKEEVIRELSISSSSYDKNLSKMRRLFEVANNQTLICTLHLSGYANQIIRCSS